MKKTASFLFLLLFALPLISCANPNNRSISFQSSLTISSAASNRMLRNNNDTETMPSVEFIVVSHYEGQNSRSFKII